MQSIGERLEEARKRKGASLREAAEATKIRGDYLQKLEANKFDLGLSLLYVRGFLRNYALWLKLPPAKLLADFDALELDSPRTARPINREVYGKMDLSASAAGRAGGGKGGDEPRGEPSPAISDPRPAAAAPGRLRQGAAPFNVRPLGDAPASDNRALFTQLGVIAGVVLLLVLVVWGIGSIFGGSKKNPAPVPAPGDTSVAPTRPNINIPTRPIRPIGPDTPAVALPPAIITALDAVLVQVWTKNADGSYGAVLLPETALARGKTVSVPRAGPLYIQASAGEKIQIDVASKRILPGSQGIKGKQPFELP